MQANNYFKLDYFLITLAYGHDKCDNNLNLQLSKPFFYVFFSELNELRKPTSDNPDILRFFKYMRAAKDGQDGLDCK